MKKVFLSALCTLPFCAQAFCGFYAATTDRKLFNKGSEVIIVRDGDHTVLTMSNDYEGDAKEFAMIIPVPHVIARNQIKLADQQVFDILNGYSAPRVAEYYDSNPCERRWKEDCAPPMALELKSISNSTGLTKREIKEKVKIEASYTIGEYDIIVLSAKESNALKIWLTQNGYKIPEGAEEVLDPYIKSNTKFFVAKVNLKKFISSGTQKLRPLQVTMQSPKFMLPIRLGMANAQDVQDLVIYAFTKNGQVECTNYRTVDIPTDFNVPMSVKSNFTDFYKKVFRTCWKRNGKNVVIKEYAWDLSGSNYLHCDPCTGTIPEGKDLVNAGLWWIHPKEELRYAGGSDYQEDAFMTRLHVRYDRAHFAQDLMFQSTPNKQSIQARYVVHHPANGNLDCAAGKEYQRSLNTRINEENKNYTYYTNTKELKPKKKSLDYGLGFMAIATLLCSVPIFSIKKKDE